MNVALSQYAVGSPASAGTSYLAIFNSNSLSGLWTGSENRTQVEIENPAVFSNLTGFISANTGYTSGSNIFRTRINSGNGSCILTWTTETGYLEDTSNTDSFDNDEKWNYMFTRATYTGGSLTFNNPSALFAPTTGTFNIYTATLLDFNGTTTNQYFCIVSASNFFSATQANYQTNVPIASTLRDFWVNNEVNTRTGGAADNIRTQINSSNGNIVVTSANGITGELEDTTNEDTIVDGDLVNYIFEAGAGTTLRNTFRVAKIELVTSNAFVFMAAQSTGNPANDFYTPPASEAGRQNVTMDTEANEAIRVDVAFTWSDLWAYVGAYALAGGGNQMLIRTRINGVTGNQLITFTGTGEQIDSTNSDPVAVGNLINYFFDLTNSGGSTTLRSTSSLATGATADISTINGLARASISTYNGLAFASVSNINGLSN